MTSSRPSTSRFSLDTPEIALAASEGLRRLIDRVAAPDGTLNAAALDTVARAAEAATWMPAAAPPPATRARRRPW
jgi:hypothetical protein